MSRSPWFWPGSRSHGSGGATSRPTGISGSGSRARAGAGWLPLDLSHPVVVLSRGAQVASALAHKPSISIAGPAVLWSVHFVFVYVFVSLGCLWGWQRYEFLGVGAIEWGVAAATVVVGAMIAAMGLRQWLEAKPRQ